MSRYIHISDTKGRDAEVVLQQSNVGVDAEGFAISHHRFLKIAGLMKLQAQIKGLDKSRSGCARARCGPALLTIHRDCSFSLTQQGRIFIDPRSLIDP